MSGMTVPVDRLMRDIEDDVRQRRRKRLLARGGAPEYRDAALYASVDDILRRAIDARDHEALVLPDFMTAEADWQLSLHLQYGSHRPVVGRFLIAMKRRLLLPLMRWLYEYSLENFRKQRRINTVLFACVEELAIENARLRQALEAVAPAAPSGVRAGGSGDGPAAGIDSGAADS
jgi:hypothetical protein